MASASAINAPAEEGQPSQHTISATSILVETIGSGSMIFSAADTIAINGSGALSIGNDADTGAVNIGTGAAARTVTIGNDTGATAVVITGGTGGVAITSTGTGDVTIDSDDTLLLDADGVLQLNSSAGVISIGNDSGSELALGSASGGALTVAGGAATQDTNISTAVTLNSISGIITTVTATVAAASVASFTVSNSTVSAGAKVLASLNDYSGTYATNGLPVVNIDNIGAGSFDVIVFNAHASNALNGVLQIAFIVANQ